MQTANSKQTTVNTIRKGLVVVALCVWSSQVDALEFQSGDTQPVQNQLQSFHVGDEVNVRMPQSRGRQGDRTYFFASPSLSELTHVGLSYHQHYGDTWRQGRLRGYISPGSAQVLTIIFGSKDSRETVYTTFVSNISGLDWVSLTAFEIDRYNVIGSRHHVFQTGVPLREGPGGHATTGYTNVTPVIPHYVANPDSTISRVATGALMNGGRRVVFSVDNDLYANNPQSTPLAPVLPGLRTVTYIPNLYHWFKFAGTPTNSINSRVFTYEVTVDYYDENHRFTQDFPPRVDLFERISRVFTVTVSPSIDIPEQQTNPTLYPSTFTLSPDLTLPYTVTLPDAEPITEVESHNPAYLSRVNYRLRGLREVNGRTQFADVGTVLPGFSVSQSGRILQGYPLAAGVNATFAYGGTDEYGDYASAQFSVTVVSNPEFTAEPAEVWWVLNQDVNITLPIAQDGRAPLSYTLNSEMDSRYSDAVFKQRFPGLTFDSTTRVLQGKLTPAENAVGVHTFRYGVTDANGHGYDGGGTLISHGLRNLDVGGLAFWNVNVAETKPGFYSPPIPSTFLFTETQTVVLVFPQASGGLGGEEWSHAFNGGNEFYGLTYSPITNLLTGKVTLPPSNEGYDPVAAAFSGVYKATDSYGFTAEETIQFLIKPRTSLYYTPPDGEIDATGPDQFPVEVYGNTVPGYGSPVDTPPFHDQLPHVFGDGPGGSSATRSGWGPYTYTLYSDNVFSFVQTGKKPYATTQNYQLNNPCNPTCPLPVLPYPDGFNVPSGWVDEPGYIGISNNSTNDSFGAGYYNEPYGKQPQMLALQYYTFALTATDRNGVESVPLPILLEVWPRLSFPSDTAAELTLPWAQEFPNHLFFSRDTANFYDLPASVGGLHYYAAGGDPSITRFTERTYAMRDIAGAQSLPGGFVYQGGTRLARTSAGTTGQIYTFVIQGNDRIDQVAFHTFTASANGDPVLHSIGDLTYTVGAPVSTLLSIQPGTGTPPFTAEAAAGSALPLGLTFDAGEFGKVRIKGVPADESVGDHPTVVEVTDYFNYSDSLLHRITVVPAPIFIEAPGDLSFAQNIVIDNFTLPIIDEDTGYGVITYQLLDENGNAFADNATVAGLSYDSTTRELSGTPTQVHQDGVVLTYIATDQNGATVQKDFRVFVYPIPAFGLAVADDITYTVGAQKITTLPFAAIGEPSPTYSLSAYTSGEPLPAGLTFDSSTRELIGDFDQSHPLQNLSYAATDSFGRADWLSFQITAVPPPSFAPQANLSYTAGHAVTPITFSAADGALPLTYSFDPGNGLADGLTFSLDEPLMLSGAPTIETAETTYVVTATDANEVEGAVSFSLQVFPDLTFPDDKLDAYTFVVAQPETITLTEANGGRPAVSYALTDNTGGLADALSFDSDARAFTASFSTLGDIALTYTAIDANNVRESFVITIRSINELLFRPPTIAVTYSVGNLTYSIDGGRYTDDLTLPAAIGGEGAITYANDDAPTGLTAAAVGDELHISGAPTAIGDYIVQRIATDAAGQQATFILTVHAASAPRFTASVAAQTYARNFRIAELTLPTVTDGAAPIVYELQDSSGNDFANGAVIAGLNFDANNRIVRGTPSAAVGDYPLTLQGIDVTTASDSLAFTITIVDALTFSIAQNDLTFSAGRPINLDLAAANGGVGALTYSIALQNAADSALDGVTVTTLNDTPTLSATTPTAVYAATPYILTAHDTSDNTAAATFTITVVDAPSFSDTQDKLHATIGAAIADTQLPRASGGASPLSYSLAPNLPNGLTISENLLISGAPASDATVGEANYTLTATDANFATAQLIFALEVYPPLAFTQPNPNAAQTFTVGTAKPLTFSPVSGGRTPLILALDLTGNNALSDLQFDATTRQLTGTFAAQTSAINLTYQATDQNGATIQYTFTLTAVPAPTFAGAQDDLTFTVSGDIGDISLPTASGGLLPLRYAFDNNLPAGVLLDDDLALTGTPTAAQATVNYVLTATDVNGASGSLPAFGIRVYPAPSFAASGFGPFTFTANAPQKSFTLPQVVDGTGAPVVAYNFGALDLFDNGGDAGVAITDLVTLDSAARTVAGSFAAALQFRAQLTATDSNNVSDTSPYATFVVVNEVTFSQSDLDGIADQTYRVGANVNRILPQVTGGIAPIAYTLSDAAGDAYGNNIANVAFNADTRAFAGTVASTATGDYTFTYAGVDANGGGATTPMRIKVVGALTLASPDDVVYYSAENNISTTLPQATNIVGNVTYRLRDLSGNGLTLPNGIAFNANANPPSLTGATDGDTFPTTQYRYTATDSFDGASVTVTFNITVIDSPVLAAQDDVTFTVGTAKAVTLPSVVGGVAPYSYWLTTGAVGGLPGWLTYSTSGEDAVPLTFGSTTSTTFSASAAVPLTYSVRDSEGTEASVAFNVLAVDAPSFSGTQNDLTFTVSGDIGTINLPTASGGALPLRYAFDNNLPAGVSLNENDARLTGTPTAVQATVNYVLTATDANGANGNLPAFGIRVYPAPSFAANGFGPFTFTANAPQKSFTLPQVVDGTGAPVVAYNFGALDLFDNGGDAGVNINDFVTLGANTRTVAGSFAAALQFRAQLTATDSNNVTDTSPYATFVVVNEVTFSQADLDGIADQTYRVGANVNRILPQVTGGIAPIAYTLSDAGGDAYGNNNNIANIAFNANTRAFAGTVASTATGDYTLTYAGVDANGGKATTPMRINIVDALALPQPNDMIYYASMSGINTALPQAENIVGDVTYQLRDLSGNGLTLPNGIAFNANANPPSLTGATDGDTFPTTQYRYTATDSFDGASVTVTFNITVIDSPVLAAQDDVTFTVGTAKAVTLPSVVGGVAPYSYWLTTGAVGGLPGWLTYSTSGEDAVPLTFGSTTSTTFSASAAVPLTYSVRDSEGTEASVAFNVLAVDAPSFSGTQNDLTFTVSGDIGTINLPTASGGALPLRYAFDNNLPAGVSLNENDAQLTGTPTAVQATVNYVLTATDANGANGNLPAFGIRVYPAPSFAANGFGPFTFTANAPQKSFTLPQVVDGTGAPVVAYNFGALDLFDNGGDAGVAITDLVTFDSTARSVAGSFAAALQFRAQLTATDSNNVSDTSPYATFVVVNEVTFSQSDLANIADQTYRVGANVNRILPQVTGGIAPIVYSLSYTGGNAYDNNNNIANIAFNADTRAFAGTVADSEVGDYTFTYAGVDANGGGATTPMRIKVVGALTLASPDDVVYYSAENNISTTLPQATNIVGNVTYRLRDLSGNGLTLPNGIAFNANANPPSLTGATDGDTFPTTKYRYTATDSFDGASVTVTFNITVSDSPVLAAQDDVTFTVGTAKAVTLPSVVGGVAPYTYLLTTSGGLPGWLIYSRMSGEDTAPLTFGNTTGSPLTAQDAVPLTYSVRDSEGTEASVAFNVLAVDAPSFSGTQDKLHATIGATIADTQLPRASGGASPLSYSLAPNLPSGLTISENLLISGAPASDATVGEANYTLTATDANGATAQLVFALEVYPPLAFVQANPSVAQTYTVGVSKMLQFSQVEGGRAPLIFALDLSGNTALSGMQFDASTRALTGTFAADTSAINLTYRATDQNGATIHYAFNITAVLAPHFVDTVGAQTYLRNRAITPLQLPVAADGATPLSYALTDSSANDFGNGAVIGGLAYTNRRISGAPTAASGDYELRYRATDNNGAHDELTFVITIVDDLVFAQQSDLVFTVNQPIESELMSARGGIGALTYDIRAQHGAALSGIAVELRDGTLTLLADTRATEYAPQPYILRVRDVVGNTATTTFTIRVVDGVAFLQQPSDVTFTVGIAKSVTLPPAHGFGAITYALSGAPSWLNVAPSSATTTDAFIISATPITMQSASVLTYGATDANAQSVSVTFAVLAVGPPRFTDTVADLTFTAGQTMDAITLPQAEDGALPLAYSLSNTLPSGMTWNRDSLELGGTPRTAQSNTSYSYTARDTNGATASLTFAIKIYPAANVAVSGYTFTANWRSTHTLPESAIGAGPFDYLVLDEAGAVISTNGMPLAPTERAQPSTNPALTFDPQSRELLGSYTLSLEKVTAENLSYRVTDANGHIVYEPFAAVIFPAPTFIADGNITFAVSTFDLDNPFAHRLPKVKTGTGAPTITYQLGADAALPSWLSANQWMADGAQLTFAIAADPVVTVTIDRTTLDAVEAAVAQSQPLPTVTYQHMAIDANGANTTLPLRITLMPGVRAEFIDDGVSRDFVDVSKVILSEAAGTLASNAIGAIANRIANARAGGFAVNGIGGQSPIFYLGGQHSLEGIIAANSKALADDTFDEKNLLSGTKFSLPFNAQGAPGDIGNGMAIWGAGEYKEMNGATGEVDWDGELRSLYFGIDGLMFANSDALGGVAIAFSKLTADYADIGADTRAGVGDYEMRLTTLYPYYSWRNDNIDWWAGAGYGEGDLKITRNADRDYSTDVFMRTMAAGANILAGIFDRTRLHIKAETIVSRLKLSQSADLAQQKIDTGLARITAEVTAAKRLPGGGRYEPSYSFGWRYDFGDSDLDASLEKTFGWRFVNAAGRLSGELRLQGAYDGHTYREWGAYALIRSEAGADGQGVSLQLRPSYGATGLDVNRLWQGGGLQAFGGDAVNPDDYTMQVDVRVGFGVTGVWNGLLTPFAEWSYSAVGDVYRLGVSRDARGWLELHLIGEQQELNSGDFRRSVWLRGKVQF